MRSPLERSEMLQQRSVPDDSNAAPLFSDEQPSGSIKCALYVGWLVETRNDAVQRHIGQLRECSAASKGESKDPHFTYDAERWTSVSM